MIINRRNDETDINSTGNPSSLPSRTPATSREIEAQELWLTVTKREWQTLAANDVTPEATTRFQQAEAELTRREADVLRGICEGKSNKEIARDLDLQEVTVKLHVKTLSRKLGAKNRTHAAMIARDGGKGGAPSGRIAASFEVLFLHGWSPHASQPRALKPGSAAHRLACVRRGSAGRAPRSSAACPA